MKLTKSIVEKQPTPDTNPDIYWDDELSGFGLKVWPSGVRSYIVQRRVNRTERRITIGKHGSSILYKGEPTTLTADLARKLAIEQIASFNSGVDPVVEKKRKESNSVSLREVAENYCKERRTKRGGELTPRTKADITRHIDKSFSDWAGKPIFHITTEMCGQRFSELSTKGATQANQAFRILRALINFASDDENPRVNPVKSLSKKRLWNPDKAKNGRIPNDKVGEVWNMLQDKRTSPASVAAAKTSADIVVFLLLTGCRWSEAAELTWDRVDMKNKTWHVAHPKNHNPVTIPMSKPLCDMLEARKKVEGCPYVFPSRNKAAKDCIDNARPTMRKVASIAGLHITPHDMRRTFMAIGTKNKVELWKLKLLTNHIAKGDVTIDHYTETNDLRELSDVTDLIAAWVVEQGRIAAAIAASDNVIPLSKAA
jgi:integrase